ncbi:OmpA family protein [Cellulomonas sp. zg-ZUI22]|uniref:OmpA family protein n=1 Tax=Cellulomonas sp. zg-ZUI22 TaxID=2816955 RepID=UPI001A93E339|nr:OmpA family protein [Cellulomonas sp. zg-ZUI22]MBO0898479.1 OmpA family protein [Cellulomonas sp. zg-ZUI22]
MRAARRRRPARAGLVVVLVAVLLAACTGGGATPDGETDGTPTADPGPRPEDVVASEVVVTSEAEVRVDVHPVVRVGDLAVLTLDLIPPDPFPETGRVHVHGWDVDGLTYHLTSEAPSNVRLVDLVRDVVLHGGTDGEGAPVVAPEGWATLRDPAGTRLQIPFAAPHPDADEVALFLPGAPLVAAVPVIDGDVPASVRPASAAAPTGTPGASGSATASASPAPAPEVLDLDAVAAAPVFPLESTSIELAGAVTTVESQERVDVSLGSDVLFEFDQDVLTPAADEALRLVAQRLTERAPGDVTVVGHTDDQGDEAYNADLSQRRARTVADALGALVDPASYPMGVEGRGESEPVAPNTSDEDRALNRRVTVTLTSTMVTRTELTTGGELPPFGQEGQVGTAGTPLPVDALIDWEVEATARRVHGHVVVDLVARNVDDRSSSGAKIGSLDGGDRGRGEGTTAPSASSSGTILHGATRVLPLDYRTGVSERHPGGEWFALADLTVGGDMDPGQARTFSFVYPELDVDTVTFQAGTGRSSSYDFRILDIPVAAEGTG